MVAIGQFFFRYRNALFPAAFLLVLLPGPRIFTDPTVATAVALAIALAGEFVRVLTIGMKYIVRGGRDRRVYAEDLVVDGAYAHCRNPMYVGNCFLVLAVAVASNTWTCVLVALPLFWFVYTTIVAAEENYLRERFGEQFQSYARQVPRWLPRLRGLGTTLRGCEFHWRRVLAKEYGTPFAWISGICLVGIWNLWRDGRLQAQSDVTAVLLSATVVTMLAWTVIRVLKKKRLLVAD